MKSKTITGFTALFGGGLGLQYFYLGKISDAVLCLFFCWTMIPAIWGVFHACIILGMSDSDFNEKYNQGKKQ